MTLPTNDDFANGELSVEELEAIAAGWPGWLKTVVRDIVIGSVVAGFGAFLVVAGAACGGNATCNNGGTPPKNLF